MFSMRLGLSPSATKLRTLCFYRRMSVHGWGGGGVCLVRGGCLVPGGGGVSAPGGWPGPRGVSPEGCLLGGGFGGVCSGEGGLVS